MTDWMNVTMEHFQAMCLKDDVMQALYKGELSWADASEDSSPLQLDGWVKPNAWSKPLQCVAHYAVPSIGFKRKTPPPASPKQVPKQASKQEKEPKKIPVISEADKKKCTLFIRDIPADVSNEEIFKQIEPIAHVLRLHRQVERYFAILRFRTPEDAQRVYLKKMNQLTLKGKVRKISFTTSE